MSSFLTVNAATNLWLTLVLIIGATVTCAFLLSQWLLWSLRKIAAQTVTTVDDRLYRLLAQYLFPLLAVSGLVLVSDFVPLSVKVMELLKRSLTVLGLLLTWYLLAKGALISLASMERHSQFLRNIKSPIESATKTFFIIHVFDAALRMEQGENDFSVWFRKMGDLSLADKVRRRDPYTYTLEGLRQKLIQLVTQYAQH